MCAPTPFRLPDSNPAETSTPRRRRHCMLPELVFSLQVFSTYLRPVASNFCRQHGLGHKSHLRLQPRAQLWTSGPTRRCEYLPLKQHVGQVPISIVKALKMRSYRQHEQQLTKTRRPVLSRPLVPALTPPFPHCDAAFNAKLCAWASSRRALKYSAFH